MDSGNNKDLLNGAVDKDSISHRLEAIYKRLEFIDAYSAEARAASILAVSFPPFINLIEFSIEFSWLLKQSGVVTILRSCAILEVWCINRCYVTCIG